MKMESNRTRINGTFWCIWIYNSKRSYRIGKKQLLVKVHGCALDPSQEITKDISVSEREILNRDSKIAIAQYAASLITDKDVVYLDAGTSTGYIIEYISASKAVFVTNAIAHARKLCNRGFEVYLPGGMVKMLRKH